jgi:hypothetical protein
MMAFIDTIAQMVQQARPQQRGGGSPSVNIPPTRNVEPGMGPAAEEAGKGFGSGAAEVFKETYLKPLMEAKKDDFRYRTDPQVLFQRGKAVMEMRPMLNDEQWAQVEENNQSMLATSYLKALPFAGKDVKTGRYFFQGMSPQTEEQFKTQNFAQKPVAEKQRIAELPMRKAEQDLEVGKAQIAASGSQQEFYKINQQLEQLKLNNETKWGGIKAEAEARKAKMEADFLPTEQKMKGTELGIQQQQLGLRRRELDLTEKARLDSMVDADMKGGYALYGRGLTEWQKSLNDQTNPKPESKAIPDLMRITGSFVNYAKSIDPSLIARPEVQSSVYDAASILSNIYQDLEKNYTFATRKNKDGVYETEIFPKTGFSFFGMGTGAAAKTDKEKERLWMIRAQAKNLSIMLTANPRDGMVASPELKSMIRDLYFAGVDEETRINMEDAEIKRRQKMQLKTLPQRQQPQGKGR